MADIQINLPFNAVTDRKGSQYFISHEVPMDLDINLRDTILMFFPSSPDGSKRPMLIVKPRRFGSEEPNDSEVLEERSTGD